MRRLTPGDVVEISTSRGLVYVLLSHSHPSYPPVVRALQGTYQDRPADLPSLVAAKPRFIAMIPLEAALDRLDVPSECVAHIDIPAELRDFPHFRMPIRNKAGDILYWWLWNGQGLSFDVTDDSVIQGLPIREVITAERFLELLEREGDELHG